MSAFVPFFLNGIFASAQSHVVDKHLEILVDNKYEEMRSRLQADYDNQNWNLLLQKKESLDSYFLPIFLLYELADERNLDFCRLLRHDYTNNELFQKKGLSSEQDKLVSEALSAFNLAGNSHVSFHLLMTRYPYVGPDYPIVLFVQGNISSANGRLIVDWYEPYLANRNLDFPIHPELFTLHWDENKLIFWEKRRTKPTDTEVVGKMEPIFNNPPFSYALFDSLRLHPVLMNAASCFGKLPTDTQPHLSDSYVSLFGKDGSVIRTTKFSFNHDRLDCITMYQEPINLLHLAPTSYLLQRQVEGEIEQEKFRPQSNLSYLKDGRVIIIEFKGQEYTEQANAGTPTEMTVYRKDKKVFEAKFDEVKYSVSTTPADLSNPKSKDIIEVHSRLWDVYKALNDRVFDWFPRYYADDELHFQIRPPLLRARPKYNVYSAIKTGEWSSLYENLERYEELLERDGIRYDMYIYSLEAITQMAFDFVDEDTACIMAGAFLKEAYRKCEPQQLLGHICRLIDQFRFGYALLAMQVLESKKDADRKILPWLAKIDHKLRTLTRRKRASYKMPDHPYAYKQAEASRIIEERLLK